MSRPHHSVSLMFPPLPSIPGDSVEIPALSPASLPVPLPLLSLWSPVCTFSATSGHPVLPCLATLPKPVFSCWKFLAWAPLKVVMESLKMTLEAKQKQQKTWNYLELICWSVILLRAPISHVQQKIWFIIHISPAQPWLKQTTLMKCWFHASETPFQIREYLEL